MQSLQLKRFIEKLLKHLIYHKQYILIDTFIYKKSIEYVYKIWQYKYLELKYVGVQYIKDEKQFGIMIGSTKHSFA